MIAIGNKYRTVNGETVFITKISNGKVHGQVENRTYLWTTTGKFFRITYDDIHPKDLILSQTYQEIIEIDNKQHSLVFTIG